MYDVIAVSIHTRKVKKMLAERKSLSNAEAIITMAVFRQGVEHQFYTEAKHGKYKVGDYYEGA